ncbi:hypothetical protein GCM10009092_43980 [Bowmanella denitrificans]|uniref:Uncharacterized protein n=1 Tax=Bowmanella denitrificans TaxID=366582 RepID=A0ABN0XWR8_9ALTE
MHKINRDGILLSVFLFVVIWAPLKLLPLFDALEGQFKIIIYLLIFIGCFWLGYRFAKKYGQKKLNKLFLQPYLRIPLIIFIPFTFSIGIVLRIPEEPVIIVDPTNSNPIPCGNFDNMAELIIGRESHLGRGKPTNDIEGLERLNPGCKVSESARQRLQEADEKWRVQNIKKAQEDEAPLAQGNKENKALESNPEQDTAKKDYISPPETEDQFSEDKISNQSENDKATGEDIGKIVASGRGEDATTTTENYRRVYRDSPSLIEEIFRRLGGGIGGAFGSKTTTVHKIVKSTSTTSFDKAGVVQQLKAQFTNLDINQAYELRKAMIAALMNQIQDGGLSEEDANDILNSIDNFLDKNNPSTKDANSKLNAWVNDTCNKLIEGVTFPEGMTLPVSTSEAIINCLNERVDDAPTLDKYVELVKGVTDR